MVINNIINQISKLKAHLLLVLWEGLNPIYQLLFIILDIIIESVGHSINNLSKVLELINRHILSHE